MNSYRCLLMCDGAEIAEGYGMYKKDAREDAMSQLSSMDRDMMDALGYTVQFFAEEL